MNSSDPSGLQDHASLSRLISDFQAALSQNKLSFFECDDCNNRFPFPRTKCLECGSEKIFVRQSAGLGRVCAFTIIHRSSSSDVKVPFGLAIIELSEGVRVYGNFEPEDRIAVGDEVTINFVAFQKGTKPVFKRKS